VSCCRPRSDRVFGDIPLECAWTAALRRDTDVAPREPVPGLEGAPVQQATVSDLPEAHDCVLLK
jgi:hypothetical protein